MSRLHTRLATGAFIAFLACQACQQPALAAGYAGRPIVDVLAELRGTGLDFIYSSDLLPRSLTVATEPTSTDRLVIARDDPKEQLRLGAKFFGGFVGAGLLLGWLMYTLPF